VWHVDVQKCIILNYAIRQKNTKIFINRKKKKKKKKETKERERDEGRRKKNENYFKKKYSELGESKVFG
jgi:hypothetical protein